MDRSSRTSDERTRIDAHPRVLQPAFISDRARDAFLANISHEIRTPLHGIVAGADLLAQKNIPEDARELVELVRASSLTLQGKLQHLLQLVAELTGERFQVPLVAEPAAGQPQAADAAGRPQILVADDHPTNRRLVELVLGDLAAVRTVNDGREAIAAVCENAFDLILMDIQMPVLDGVSAVAEIRNLERRQNRPRTPIAMLTANTDPVNLAASFAAGADGHIAKPFTAGLLIHSVREMLYPHAA